MSFPCYCTIMTVCVCVSVCMCVYRDVIEIPSDDGGDALNIKPPQSQAGVVRRDKSHKRKHKADRRRDKQKLSQMKDRDRDRKLLLLLLLFLTL